MRVFLSEAYAEFSDRKIVYLYAVMTLIALFVIMLANKVQMSFEMDTNVESLQYTSVIQGVLTYIVTYFISMLVFLTVMATAGIMPNALVKGRSEYYLSRPYSRFSFYLNKVLSCWTVYGALILACGLVGLLALWLIHDVAAVRLLYGLGLSLVLLLIWFVITFSVGVITGSTTSSIMAAFMVYFAHWFLSFRESLAALLDSQAVSYALDALYYILPKPREIADITLTVAGGKPVESWMPLWSSLLFVIVLAIATIQIFNRKDY